MKVKKTYELKRGVPIVARLPSKAKKKFWFALAKELGVSYSELFNQMTDEFMAKGKLELKVPRGFKRC